MTAPKQVSVAEWNRLVEEAAGFEARADEAMAYQGVLRQRAVEAEARVEELEAALREQDGEPGCCACAGGREEGDEHQRLCWIGAVLRSDRKEDQ